MINHCLGLGREKTIYVLCLAMASWLFFHKFVIMSLISGVAQSNDWYIPITAWLSWCAIVVYYDGMKYTILLFLDGWE